MMFRRIVVAAERIAYRASGSWSFLDRSDFCGREDLARINGQRFCVVASSRKTFPYNGIIRTDDDVHYLALVLRVSERAVPVLLNEVHSFRNNGSQDLEFMIVGVASQKGVLETVVSGSEKSSH